MWISKEFVKSELLQYFITYGVSSSVADGLYKSGKGYFEEKKCVKILLYRSIFFNILQKAQFITNSPLIIVWKGILISLWFFVIMPTNIVYYHLYQGIKMPIDWKLHTRFSLSYLFILKFP